MRPSVLVISATDSSGGAGLVRDVEVLTHLGTAVRCAVTAVTAQSDVHVQAVHHVPAALVRAQIERALAQGDIAAIKIGMLGTRATVQAVTEALPPRERIPIVLDPVLRASSGGVLLDAEGQDLLCTALVPRVTLLTPNMPEAAALLGAATALDEEQRLRQAERLLAWGPEAVLLKGGHGGGACALDLLLRPGRDPIAISVPRVAATLRGTGCMLASAIAAELAVGVELETACRRAQGLIERALRASMTGDAPQQISGGSS